MLSIIDTVRWKKHEHSSRNERGINNRHPKLGKHEESLRSEREINNRHPKFKNHNAHQGGNEKSIIETLS